MSDQQSKKKGGKRKGDEDQEDTEEGLGIQQKMTKRKKKSKHKQTYLSVVKCFEVEINV